MIVDLFAGGGGASTGIEMALGRSPDVAVNHDAEAVAMHAANHPHTRHLCGSVWDYAPRDVTGGEHVELLWASPDCTHFSRARGGKPKSTKRRALAWVAVRWAREVRPDVIAIENVTELLTWGPLGPDGTPCPRRSGRTWRAWVRALEAEGYTVEHRELRACDYGAPTSRRRLFVVARRSGSVVWPTATHGRGGLPYRTAAECIDWSIPAPSIFGRKKPLAHATLRRIAAGLEKFVFGQARPFVVGDATPYLVQTSYGEREGQAPRILDLHAPLTTVVAGGVKHGLVYAFVAKNYGGHSSPGQDLRSPLSTITCKDHHALVTASEDGDHAADVRRLLADHGGTQLRLGTRRPIADIGFRLLTPRELFNAQGFSPSHVVDPVVGSKRLGTTAQVRMCGNSVPPQLVAAIVAANVPTARSVAA